MPPIAEVLIKAGDISGLLICSEAAFPTSDSEEGDGEGTTILTCGMSGVSGTGSNDLVMPPKRWIDIRGK